MSYSCSFSFNSFKVRSAVPPAGVWILRMLTPTLPTQDAVSLENQVHQTKTTSKTPSTLSESRVPIRTSLLCQCTPNVSSYLPQIPIVGHIKLQCSGCVRQNVQVYSKTLPIIEFDDRIRADVPVCHKSDTPYLY